MKLAFKMMGIFWTVSPLTFLGLRAFGIFNYPFDWLIFAVLALISFITMFLTFEH